MLKKVFKYLIRFTIVIILLFAILIGALYYVKLQVNKEYLLEMEQRQKVYVTVSSQARKDLYMMCMLDIKLHGKGDEKTCEKIYVLYKEDKSILEPINTPYLDAYRKLFKYLKDNGYVIVK